MSRIVAMMLILVSAVCSVAFAGEARAESDAEFLKSYSASFMQSCLDSAGGSEYKTTCECVLNDLKKNFSVAELKDNKKISDYVDNVALKKCDK